MKDYKHLRALYGNVHKLETTGDKIYKRHADGFWKQFNKYKNQNPDKADEILERIQNSYTENSDSESDNQLEIVIRSLESNQGMNWKRARYLAFVIYGNKCTCCGRHASQVPVNIDHIKPRSRFPELATDLRNLQPLCEECNIAKCSWEMTDWRSTEQKFKAIHIMNFPKAIRHYARTV